MKRYESLQHRCYSLKRNVHGFWNVNSNHESFLNSVKKELNIHSWKDWYRVTQRDLRRVGGSRLLEKYGGSVSLAITSIFPNHPWKLWDFKTAPRSFWNSRTNQREFLEFVQEKLNVVSWQDWYHVTAKDLIAVGGKTVLSSHGNSPSKLIMSSFPDHPWNQLKFHKLPQSFWKDRNNQRNFLESVKDELKVKNWEDWYRVSFRDIERVGGGSVIEPFEGSPSKLLVSAYPEHPWKIFMFQTKALTWTPEQARSFLDWVAHQKHILNPLDWKTISTTQIMELKGGSSMLSQVGSLRNALKLAYPKNNWYSLLPLKVSVPQGAIVTILSKFIPRQDMVVNYRHPEILHGSGRKAELDVWLPSFNLGIEYHGEHHYHQLWEKAQHPSVRKNRDTEKRILCQNAGVGLVEVPYWWDKSAEQLIGLVRCVKPDFLIEIEEFQHIKPLTIVQPLNQFVTKITLLNLANEWNPLRHISEDWWISEKLDGHRASWNGINLYSRNQNSLTTPIPLPPFRFGVGKLFIDGELWYGRKKGGHNLTLQTFDALEFSTKSLPP